MSPEQIGSISRQFEGAYPEDLLRWTFNYFGSGAAMATGFGPSGVVLMHMLSHVAPEADVFYLDTDLLFPETHELKRELADRFGLRFTRVHSGLSLQEQAAREGEHLWRSDPDRCCFLRKVQPLREFLQSRTAWITGIRRDQSPTRSEVGLVEWDGQNGLVKLNPLAAWTKEDVWRYIDMYDLPYNVLHDRGYPSVGCIPCTKPVAEGEDSRAGRWRGHVKIECGIHASEADDSHSHAQTTHVDSHV